MKKQLLLNRNEVAQGPSPKVIQAVRRFTPGKASFYFDGYYGSVLGPRIANEFGVPEERVSVGYGIEFFLRSILDGLDPKTDTVLTHDRHYTFFDHYTKAKGLTLRTFRMIDRGDRFEFDVKDCIKKIRARAPKVVLIVSPNNPTGNTISAADLKKIARAAGKRTLVVLDESYYGFDRDRNDRGFLALLTACPNLVLLRGFSKLYALAGLRIGFALWGKTAKQLARYDDLYLGGSRILEEAAIAALDAKPYYRALRKEIMADREFFIKNANRLRNFRAYSSGANFVIVKVGTKAVPLVRKFLADAPVIIAKFVTPDFMRVSIGVRKNTAGFLAAMKRIDGKISG